MKKIVIIGSANTDLIVATDRIPRPGETVLGGEFRMVSGGKGANQAVAVARLGGDAVFVARVGSDVFGEELLNGYRNDGMDISHVVRDAGAPTGVALISVDSHAENCIVVAPGANGRMTREDIDAVTPVLAEAEYLLLQLEIPLDVVEYAIAKAADMGVKVILNPAPAAKIAPEALARLYAITPNETECSLLTGVEIASEADAAAAADALHSLGIPNVVITCGKRGALISTGAERVMVPARKVNAVDTTAAGDVFNGALTVGLAEGKTMVEAARMATCASAIAVTRIGAQSSIPTRCEVDAMLNE